MLQYSFSCEQLSVMAGISYWRFYFRLFNGSIKSPQIVEFLKALQATIGQKLLIIWDRLQAHRSKLVRAHVQTQRGRIALEYLPAYAPEPHRARSNLRSMQRRPTLARAFWQQAELF